jgi:hypothetical protein
MAASPAPRSRVQHRSGLVRPWVYDGLGCGYGTGVGQSAVASAGGVQWFPAVLTSFIGRAVPVREIGGLLAGRRLVTVTGPGGAGRPGCQ